MKERVSLVGYLVTCGFFIHIGVNSIADDVQISFQNYCNQLESAFIEVHHAAHVFSKCLEGVQIRSFDHVYDDLAEASTGVLNAIDLCSNLIQKQKLFAAQIQKLLNKNSARQVLLEQKIQNLEKERHIQALLQQKMFLIIQQAFSQIIAYSDYMRSLDKMVCELVAEQNQINQRIAASTGIILT